MESKYVQHPMTAWADTPNYVIEGTGLYGDGLVTEQLWARKLENGDFELCCLPFYLYGLALLDIVRETPSGALVLVKASGRQLYRIMFLVECDEPENFDREVGRFGCRTEWYSRRFLCIDCPAESADEAGAWLADQERLGRLHLEWANTVVPDPPDGRPEV